jgi:hypothetical protein
MRHDKDLSALLELFHERQETLEVDVVERCLDLVQ